MIVTIDNENAEKQTMHWRWKDKGFLFAFK